MRQNGVVRHVPRLASYLNQSWTNHENRSGTAAGGAFGAVARYYVSIGTESYLGRLFHGETFRQSHWLFRDGRSMELMAVTWSPSAELRAFLTIGF